MYIISNESATEFVNGGEDQLTDFTTDLNDAMKFWHEDAAQFLADCVTKRTGQKLIIISNM